MSREAAYSALFELLTSLQTQGLVKTCDRKVRAIDDMNEPELPALFMAVHDQEAEVRDNFPPMRTWGAYVYLYTSNPDPNTPAGIALNNLLDAVEAALSPGWRDEQTLGGLVDRCRIEGTIEIFEGLLGQRAAAIVPVKMLVP
jgi:hypothetical protein